MKREVGGLILVRAFERPYKVVYAGGHPRYIVIHEGQSRHGLGRKNSRRGWKQHYAKYPQRGLAFYLAQRNAILEARKEARAKAQ